MKKWRGLSSDMRLLIFGGLSFLYLLMMIPAAIIVEESDEFRLERIIALSLVIGFVFIWIPAWVLAVWYWWQWFYVRRGVVSAWAGAMAAFVFLQFSIPLMIWHYLNRDKALQHEECPYCHRLKLAILYDDKIFHTVQPHCPHCHQVVADPLPNF